MVEEGAEGVAARFSSYTCSPAVIEFTKSIPILIRTAGIRHVHNVLLRPKDFDPQLSAILDGSEACLQKPAGRKSGRSGVDVSTSESEHSQFCKLPSVDRF